MKNYHFILIAGLCLFLSSCEVPVRYFGDQLKPSSTVEVFYSAHDVKKEYKVIGHLSCPNIGEEEAVKAKLIERARIAGADAIIITGSQATKDNQAAVVNADALKYN